MKQANIITEEQVDIIWELEVIQCNKVLKANSNPKAFILGGQPGAGKSNLTAQITRMLENNVIEINGDNFRKYHPKYNDFIQEDILSMPEKTAEFSGAITQAILNKAIKEKYNIVIEGTFRTSKTPINTLKLFKDNGYETNVLIQTCDKDISWQSCLERFEKMKKENPKEARYTNKAHHDNVVENLAKNIQEVQKSALADNMKIYVRIPLKNNPDKFEQKNIYDSALKSKVNIVTINKYLGNLKNLNKDISNGIGF